MDSTNVRAVVAARVSHVQGSEKTSHLSQAERGVQYAEMHGWTVVGTVEDLDVSATKLGPWDRPDLKKWLTERRWDFDALIFTKTDRVFRRADDSVDLSRWAQEHKKILVIIDDGIKLDFHTPESLLDPFSLAMAKMFLYMSSFFAEIEGRRFMQRANDRVMFLKRTDRWGYGIAPYGYVVAPHPSGKGKTLELDPMTQPVLHDIAEKRLLEKGESLVRIVASLNDEGVPSPRDVRRIQRGDKPRGDSWTVGKLKRILTSPATQGIKVSKGKPILNENGEPIRVGPPSFSQDVWDQIQKAIAERSQNPRQRRHSLNPILGIGKCGMCGKSLRQRSQTIITKDGERTHRYYLCGKSPVACTNYSIRADFVDELVAEAFLEKCGALNVRKREYVAGEDNTYELEEIERTIEALREDRALGLFSSPEDQETYRRQMKALVARRDDLKTKPVVKAGWRVIVLDQTYAEAWEAADLEGRRKLLTDAGVKFYLHGKNHWEIEVPTDIEERMISA